MQSFVHKKSGNTKIKLNYKLDGQWDVADDFWRFGDCWTGGTSYMTWLDILDHTAISAYKQNRMTRKYYQGKKGKLSL